VFIYDWGVFMKKVSVIICAAGASSRFGGDRKKPFVDVAGRPAFLRSIDFFAEREDVAQVLLAISREDEELVTVKWGAALGFAGVKLCFGGAERFETVANALEKVKNDADLIAVHDAVRCCLTDDWIDELFKTAGDTGGAMLACPVVSTLKKVTDGTIVETVDRAGLFEAQTPQVFDAKRLKDAYANSTELSLLLRGGQPYDNPPPSPIHGFVRKFSWDLPNEFRTEDVVLTIPKGSLYEDLDFTYVKSEKFNT